MISLVTSMMTAIYSRAKYKIDFQFSPIPLRLSAKTEGLTAQSLRLVLFIGIYYNNKFRSTPLIQNQTVCEKTGLSLRGVQRARNQLVEAGIIVADQQDGNPKSNRWAYKWTAEILGFDPAEKDESKPESKPKSHDKDVGASDKDVGASDNTVDKTMSLDEFLNSMTDKVSGPKKKVEKADIRFKSIDLNYKRGFEESKSEATAQPKPLAVASGFAGGDKSVKLVDDMLAKVESRLAAGEVVDLEDWKSIAIDAVHPIRGGAKILLDGYNQELVKGEWFKRLANTHKHLREG